MKKSVEKLINHISDVLDNIEFKNVSIMHVLNNFEKVKSGKGVYVRYSIEEDLVKFDINQFLDDMGIDNFEENELVKAISRNNDLIKKFQSLKWLFSSSQEELYTGSKHISSFFLLSILLEDNYKENEIFEIINEACCINDRTDIMGNFVITLDDDKLKNFNFQTVTKEEKELYLAPGVRALLENAHVLDEKGQNFVEEILANLESLTIDNHIKNKEATIKTIEILVYKENTYDEADIEQLIEALKVLELSNNLCMILKRRLERDLEKRRKKESKQVSSERKITTPTTASTKHYISDSEYKKLKKEVLKFYDLHTGELKQELSYEETLEVASIMIRLDYDKQEVYAFLMRALKKEEVTSNIIASFVRDYNKYIYYLGKESLSDILEYLKEMVILNDEDYMYWKNGVEEAINELNKQLPHKVDYEYELAKKM